MSVIKVSNAYKKYHSDSEPKIVLSKFHMNVEKGMIYALMGSSGCGKTTLISCLVGISNLDSGDIEIFGEPTRQNKSRIGYMPQENALIPEFTIREMVWFFGTILSLCSVKIKTRLKFLTELLELPDTNRFIRDCSGGQQRRVSLALTLVHEPELLILDEPTVGLDPILRKKIWDYFTQITETKNVTILLSTHYIEEARFSSCVGLMRKGVQIAEDSPENILLMMETTQLEDAFLKLSEKQERELPIRSSKRSSYKAVGVDFQGDSTTTIKKTNKKSTVNVSSWTILTALLMKNLTKIRRRLDVLITSLAIPLIGCLCLHFGIGGRIRGLSFGFVNNEVSTIDECFNHSLVTFEVKNYDCTVHKISCRFINEFNNETAHKKYFKSFEDAYQETKLGNIVGFIQFSSNFSESFPFFNNKAKSDHSDNGFIQVYLDQSDLQITSMIQRNIYETYQNFSEKLMTDCGKSRDAGSSSMVFEAAFGSIDFNFKSSIVPGFLIGAFFSISSYITSISIITSRIDGTWDRTIVAGASPVHFFWAHFLEGLVIMMLQFLEYLCYTIFFLQTTLTLNSSVLLSLLLLFTGLTGLTFGLLLSVVMETVMQAYMVAQFFIYPTSFISGMIWPIEALPIALKCVGYLLPFALTVTAFRNVLTKNSTIHDQTVLLAFLVLSTWIAGQIILCLWFIREKDENKIKSKK